jgi:hypothetical protein
VGFELTTLVVIGTDCNCIGSYKSNYHTITTMMAPYHILWNVTTVTLPHSFSLHNDVHLIFYFPVENGHVHVCYYLVSVVQSNISILSSETTLNQTWLDGMVLLMILFQKYMSIRKPCLPSITIYVSLKIPNGP